LESIEKIENKKLSFENENDLKNFLIKETEYHFGKYYNQYKVNLLDLINKYIQEHEYLQDKNIEDSLFKIFNRVKIK